MKFFIISFNFSYQLVVGRVLGPVWFCRLFFLCFFLGLFVFSFVVLWGQVVFLFSLESPFWRLLSNIHLFFYLSKKKKIYII